MNATMWRLLAVFASLLAWSSALGAGRIDGMVVVVDKLADYPVATAEHPIFYVPLIAGYAERGATIANEKPPTEQRLLEHVWRALALRHYLLSKPTDPRVTMALAVAWGYCNPVSADLEADSLGEAGRPPPVRLNEAEMMALVAGKTVDRADDEDLKADTEEARADRYFLTVTAIDYVALLKKSRKPYWIARLSVRSSGVSMAEALPALADTGGLYFGQETAQPARVSGILGAPGKVEVGEPVVVPPSAPRTP